MKKMTLNLMLLFFLSLASVTATASEKNTLLAEKPVTEVPADVKILLDRLEEIKNIDKSNLESSERKELRREVREIKRELKGKGFYLSTAAIIIIVLLILLL